MKDRLFKVRIYLISTMVHAKFVFGKCWANDVISRAKHIIAYTTYYRVHNILSTSAHYIFSRTHDIIANMFTLDNTRDKE